LKKKILIGTVKIGISAAILAWLAIQAHRNAVFTDLAVRPKHWELLASAAAVCFAAVMITFVRWYYLVRALDIPFTLREAIRLGFLGFLFNLAPMGIVGGDLLKAVVLARKQTGHRAEAVATVLVDRIIGLYVLFLVASAAIGLTGLWQNPVLEVQVVCKLTWVVTAVGTAAVVLPLFAGLTGGNVTGLIGRLPYAGEMAQRLLGAVRVYRRRFGVLILSALMTVPVHCLFAVAVYMIAIALYDPVLPLGTHFVVVPLSASTAVIPFPMGPFEAVLDRLYAVVPLPGGGLMAAGQGLVVALVYRVVTVLLAAVGMFYYLVSRREVSEMMHSADLEEEAGLKTGPEVRLEAGSETGPEVNERPHRRSAIVQSP
jgi:hypothetical protein